MRIFIRLAVIIAVLTATSVAIEMQNSGAGEAAPKSDDASAVNGTPVRESYFPSLPAGYRFPNGYRFPRGSQPPPGVISLASVNPDIGNGLPPSSKLPAGFRLPPGFRIPSVIGSSPQARYHTTGGINKRSNTADSVIRFPNLSNLFRVSASPAGVSAAGKDTNAEDGSKI